MILVIILAPIVSLHSWPVLGVLKEWFNDSSSGVFSFMLFGCHLKGVLTDKQRF